MDLLRLALSLSLPMEGAEFTGDYSFDVTPTFGVPMANGLPWGASATTLPGMVLYDDREYLRGTRHHLPSSPELQQHELGHVDQQSALGPAFWLGYALSGGQAFEPYNPLRAFLGPPSSYQERSNDMSRTWMPPPDMPRDFPIFRLKREDDTTSIQFMPGYPGVTFDAP